MDALEGTADITLRDVPKEGAESASNSLRISQDGNKCEISITPAIEGSLAFDIVSQRDVLIKVGGIY